MTMQSKIPTVVDCRRTEQHLMSCCRLIIKCNFLNVTANCVFQPPQPICTIVWILPKKLILLKDILAKPDGVLSFADIDYETALGYQHVYAANPDHNTQPGSNFLIWRTPEVKVKEGKNENVVDKVSILIDLGSESAVDLTTRAFIEENGGGVVIYKPLHSPELTKLWDGVKEEIMDLSENGADDDAGPMMTAVRYLYSLNDFNFNKYHSHTIVLFSLRLTAHRSSTITIIVASMPPTIRISSPLFR